NEKAGTWLLPYDQIRTSSAGASAYPGTMLVSTAVPTEGLSKTDGERYAEFMRFVAGPGQQPGLQNGQLPPGYLPRTAGNGRSTMARYTQAAADAVAAQEGATVSVTTLKTTTPSGNQPGGGSTNPPTGGDTSGTGTTGSASGGSTTPPTTTGP